MLPDIDKLPVEIVPEPSHAPELPVTLSSTNEVSLVNLQLKVVVELPSVAENLNFEAVDPTDSTEKFNVLVGSVMPLKV